MSDKIKSLDPLFDDLFERVLIHDVRTEATKPAEPDEHAYPIFELPPEPAPEEPRSGLRLQVSQLIRAIRAFEEVQTGYKKDQAESKEFYDKKIRYLDQRIAEYKQQVQILLETEGKGRAVDTPTGTAFLKHSVKLQKDAILSSDCFEERVERKPKTMAEIREIHPEYFETSTTVVIRRPGTSKEDDTND